MKPETLYTEMIPYGLLLTFDGYGAPESTCRDTELLYSLLETLPPYIGMRPLGQPHIVSVEEDGIRGLSGFTFIMESHISVHTYEERGFVTVDIYSCKEFNAEDVSAYIAFAFGVESFDTNVLARGTRFNDYTIPQEEISPLAGP